MKTLKFLMPIAFLFVATAISIPKANAVSADDFFKDLREDFDGKVVAFYQSGLHGVVGESNFTHEGIDLVVENDNGCKNEFIQWFWGKSSEGKLEGDKSVWKITDGESCPKNEILVKNASASWGDYLKPGANYCVKTTEFNLDD